MPILNIGLLFKYILGYPSESSRDSIFLIAVYDWIESKVSPFSEYNSAFIIYKFGSAGDQSWKSLSCNCMIISWFDLPSNFSISLLLYFKVIFIGSSLSEFVLKIILIFLLS